MCDCENKENTISISEEDRNALERMYFEYNIFIDSIAFLLDRHLLDTDAKVYDTPQFQDFYQRACDMLLNMENKKHELLNKYVGSDKVVNAYTFRFNEKELTYIL